jgi:heptosyltransferase-2
MNIERILFIQTAFLGDAILALPAIQKLKELNPDLLIDVLCIPETEEIFSASASVNKAIIIDKKNQHKSI